MNKFEKVSSDGHHMSLAGGGGFPVERGRLGQGEVGLGESLYREGLGQREVGRSTMKFHVLRECGCTVRSHGTKGNGPWEPPVDRQTHTSENITFLQFRWHTVIIQAETVLVLRIRGLELCNVKLVYLNIMKVRNVSASSIQTSVSKALR